MGGDELASLPFLHRMKHYRAKGAINKLGEREKSKAVN